MRACIDFRKRHFCEKHARVNSIIVEFSPAGARWMGNGEEMDGFWAVHPVHAQK